MKLLKILLWMTGIIYLMALPALLLPWSSLVSLSMWFGIKLPSNFPIIIYMFKTVCAIVIVMGVFYIILGRNPLGYGPMLLLASWGLVFMGLVCLLTGLLYSLPLIVFAGDTLFCLLVGSMMTVLAYREK